MSNHHGRSAYAVAIHEAGHAVVAYEQGRGSSGIDIWNEKGTDDYAGWHTVCYTDAFPMTIVYSDGRWLLGVEQWNAERLEAETVGLMGGEAAGLEFKLPTVEMGMSDDRIKADDFIRRLVLLTDPVAPIELCIAKRSDLWFHACEIVRTNWAAIQALAEELERRLPNSRLDGHEISDIVTANCPTD